MSGQRQALDEIAHLLARLDDVVGQARIGATPLERARDGTLDAHTRSVRSDLVRQPRPPLPDPRLIRRIIRQRRLRDRYFESELFADPGWDILLELTASRAENRRISVTALCAAAAVPDTTALRWITMMTEMGHLVSHQDDLDKRRRHIALSDDAANLMARYFDEIGREAARMV